MQIKEIKAWLWRARGVDKEIKSLLKTRENEYSRLTSITAQLTGITVSGTKDPHKYDHLAELDDLIMQRCNELTAVKNEILAAIFQLEDQRYREVLKLYYVDCKTLEQIAVDMGYSFHHISHLKYEAIIAMKSQQTITTFSVL